MEELQRVDQVIFVVKITLYVLWCCVITVYYTLLELFYYFSPKREKSIRGWHVLVTGAGRGLGHELALCFAKEGCRVTCVDIDEDSCHETARLVNEMHPEQAQAFKLDVTDREAVNRFALMLEENVALLDILVNNAGIVQSAGLLTMSDKDIETMMNVNTMAHFWTIRAFLPSMKQRRRGHIMAVSSVAAITAASHIAPYTASKCAVSGLMACLREELRKKNSEVETTVVQPFFISPWNNHKHWELKTVLSDVPAWSVAAQAVKGLKQDKFNITVPCYLYFSCLIIKMLPAKAADLWRDVFSAQIDPLQRYC